jgi:hypothetical protein
MTDYCQKVLGKTPTYPLIGSGMRGYEEDISKTFWQSTSFQNVSSTL